MKILGICGSLRKGSLNMVALKACRELMPQGMTMDTIAEIGDIPPPNYSLACYPTDANRGDALLEVLATRMHVLRNRSELAPTLNLGDSFLSLVN